MCEKCLRKIRKLCMYFNYTPNVKYPRTLIVHKRFSPSWAFAEGRCTLSLGHKLVFAGYDTPFDAIEFGSLLRDMYYAQFDEESDPWTI